MKHRARLHRRPLVPTPPTARSVSEPAPHQSAEESTSAATPPAARPALLVRPPDDFIDDLRETMIARVLGEERTVGVEVLLTPSEWKFLQLAAKWDEQEIGEWLHGAVLASIECDMDEMQCEMGNTISIWRGKLLPANPVTAAQCAQSQEAAS